jgi:hypothetical protein
MRAATKPKSAPPTTRPVKAGRALSVGGPVDKVSVSIRLIGRSNLDPDWVTRLLGVRPTFARRRGELVGSNRSTATSKSGIWILDVKQVTGVDLELVLWSLLRRVPFNARRWSKILKKARADVFCGLHLSAWNRGLGLSPDILGELARRRMTLDLDIYGDNGRLESVSTARDRQAKQKRYKGGR